MKNLIYIFLLTTLLFSFCKTLNAKNLTVRGTVTASNSNLGLPNVRVIIKGTNIGTKTDFQGKYKIKVRSEKDLLVFSAIGMKTKTVPVRFNKPLDVVLEHNDTRIMLDMEIEETNSSIPEEPHSSIRESQKTYVLSSSPNYERESYSKVTENEFREVSQNPLSTFSVDVDVASYSNVRRMINSGHLPNIDAVRIEEMINYFDYDYPQPKGEEPMSINTELSICPWNKENLLLHIGLKAKEISLKKLPPSNIVFLLDVSGSMSDNNKLPLVKSSLKLLVEQLRAEDKVAIVVYAGSSGLVLPSTSGSYKKKILDALEKLEAGGSTAGGKGLRLAYKVAEENIIKEGNNRIILATDGDFNVGEQSNAAMEHLIEQERKKGIAISVLGVGMGNYKGNKLEILADKGNGNYAYIDNLLEAKKVLVNEFGGTFYTVAKDVKLQLEFNPIFVKKYRLVGYENRLMNEEDFEKDEKDAGEVGLGHTVTALYEIIPQNKGKDISNGLRYQESTPTKKALKNNELVNLKLRYKKPNGVKSILLERIVKNMPILLQNTSNNFQFSASVAEFGLLLRNSKFKGSATWKSAKELAEKSRGVDKDGYRAEMIRLIEATSLLKK